MDQCLITFLGPILVQAGDGIRSPGGPVGRSVLALLGIHANHPVSRDRLLDDIWGRDGPSEVHALQSMVYHLRALIGESRIVSIDHSYLLDVDDDDIDTRRFEGLVATAAEETTPSKRRRLCRDALELWRGVPFGDLSDRHFLQAELHRLGEIRLQAIELCTQADLELGRHREIIPSLQSAVTEFPYNEVLWSHYLTALGKSGRRAEAILAYEELSRRFRTELGIEPGDALREALSEAIAGESTLPGDSNRQPPDPPIHEPISSERLRAMRPELRARQPHRHSIVRRNLPAT